MTKVNTIAVRQGWSLSECRRMVSTACGLAVAVTLASVLHATEASAFEAIEAGITHHALALGAEGGKFNSAPAPLGFHAALSIDSAWIKDFTKGKLSPVLFARYMPFDLRNVVGTGTMSLRTIEVLVGLGSPASGTATLRPTFGLLVGGAYTWLDLRAGNTTLNYGFAFAAEAAPGIDLYAASKFSIGWRAPLTLLASRGGTLLFWSSNFTVRVNL